VIGVVSSASHAALDEPEKGNVYLAAGAMQKSAFLVVRTARSTGEMAKAVRAEIAALDPNQPVFLSASMRDLIADSVADRRFIMMLLAITGGLALATSTAVGIGLVVGLSAALGVHSVSSKCGSRARIRSSCPGLDRGHTGNGNRWNGVLDSSAASYQDGPDFRTSAGIDRNAAREGSRSAGSRLRAEGIGQADGSPGCSRCRDPLIVIVREAALEVRLKLQRAAFYMPGAVGQLRG
jgi:hypothetical protein